MAATGTPQSGSVSQGTRSDVGSTDAAAPNDPPPAQHDSSGEEEAASNRAAFWEALARGDRSLAMEMLQRINPPDVVNESMFDFDEESDDGGGRASSSGSTGALVGWPSLTVEVGTPTSVVGGWNSDREVSMVRVDLERMCLGKIKEVKKGEGLQCDFRACTLLRMNLSGIGDERACKKFTHLVEGGGGREQFDVKDPDGVFAIAIPTTGPHIVQQGIFSRPVFRVSDFPF